jgi:hypothetical protein
VSRPEAGRKLVRDAILKYLPEDAPAKYLTSLAAPRKAMRGEIKRLLKELE